MDLKNLIQLAILNRLDEVPFKIKKVVEIKQNNKTIIKDDEPKEFDLKYFCNMFFENYYTKNNKNITYSFSEFGYLPKQYKYKIAGEIVIYSFIYYKK